MSALIGWLVRAIASLFRRARAPLPGVDIAPEPPPVYLPMDIPIADTTEEPTVPEPIIPFSQALHFTRANRSQIDLVVLHSAEIGEVLDGAEILMRRCAEKRVNAKGEEIKSSWHFAVDADSVTQSVLERDVAWHAPGANANGIGIEMTGRARQTAAEWDDAFSRAMLERCAVLVATLCNRWNIPAVFVPADALLRGVRGVTSHASVSAAWKKSNHTDPGASFPMGDFIDLVRRELDALA